jgi:hypothetical protein
MSAILINGLAANEPGSFTNRSRSRISGSISSGLGGVYTTFPPKSLSAVPGTFRNPASLREELDKQIDGVLWNAGVISATEKSARITSRAELVKKLGTATPRGGTAYLGRLPVTRTPQGIIRWCDGAATCPARR